MMIAVFEDYSELKKGIRSTMHEEDIQHLSDYLKHHPVVFGWMHYVSDIETGAMIEPHCCRNDGQWVWPSCFLHYLEKLGVYDHYLEFLNHIQNSCIVSKSNKRELNKIERGLMNLI